MKIVHFQRIPKLLEKLEVKFDDSVLDLWFWLLILRDKGNVIKLYAYEHIKEIEQEVFALARKIEKESVILKSKISRRMLSERVKRELADIQQIMDRCFEA